MLQHINTTNGNPHNILLFDQDMSWSRTISDYLANNDLAVHARDNGSDAMLTITSLAPEIVIVDAKLPGKSGFDICRELRATGNSIPIMVLSKSGEDFDHVLGLELGADDYLNMPIPPRILLARIRALMRRAVRTDEDSDSVLLKFGRLKIHGVNREVTLDEQRIMMTSAEFDLLWLLATNAGKVMHRSDILKALRGLELIEGDRSVDARLYRLRRRFGKDRESSWKIKTVRPHGYMFCNEAW